MTSRASRTVGDRWRALPLGGQLACMTLAAASVWLLPLALLDRSQHARQTAAAAELSRASQALLVVAGAEADMTIMRATTRRAAAGDAALRSVHAAARQRLAARSDTLLELGGEDRPFLAAAARLRGAVRDRDEIASPATLETWQDGPYGAMVSTARDRAARAASRSAAVDRSTRRDSILVRVALVTAILLALILGVRRITRTLDGVIADARSLATGASRSPRAPSPSGREIRELTAILDQLALASAQREQILQSDILQLRAVEELKNDFVSTVSHELRTPLTSVRGALGLVLAGTTGPVTPQTRELLQIAQSNSERLIRLINDILDVEALEAPHTALRSERCDVADVLRTTIASLGAMAVEADVHLMLEGAPAAIVTGDTDRLVQVFTNLVSNAIKFSPRGERVSVRLETTTDSARITVRDRGPGIPAEFEGRIFGRFQRAAEVAGKPGGTGLGLAIARAIVERHGGTIGYTPAPDGGTSFFVELPYTAPTAPSTTPSDRHRLLVVEPDPGMLRVLCSMLQPLGDAVGVRSAEDGWALLPQHTYDAIVIDPDVAASNGLDFVRRVRTCPGYADVPVLVFSAHEYAARELEGVTLSASHAYVKSRDREQELMYRLKAVLAVRRPR